MSIAKSVKKKKFTAPASTVYNIKSIKIQKSDVFKKKSNEI